MVFENNYVLFLIIIISGLYLKVKVTRKIEELINNKFIKLLIIYLITYFSIINIQISIFLSIIYLVLLNSINKIKIEEDFRNLNKFLF